MDDLSSVLSSIMENPEAFEQLKNTASMLFGEKNQASENSEQQKRENNPTNDFKRAEGDIFPLIAKIAPLLSSFGKDDESTRLLYSLRPFLGDERQHRLDEAIKMLHVMRLIPMLKEQNIL